MVDRQRISSGSPFEPTIGFNGRSGWGTAVRVGDRAGGAGRRLPRHRRAQARRCFEIIEGALAEAGAALFDVVRTRMYITTAADAPAVGAVHGELLGHVRPAATMVVVAALLDPAWKVEVEAEAVLPRRARAD